MNVRAKFKVSSILPSSEQGAVKVELFPVYSADPNHENKSFWDATPSGGIWMVINNLAAVETFKEGQEYYVDFTPAE